MKFAKGVIVGAAAVWLAGCATTSQEPVAQDDNNGGNTTAVTDL